jgi:hypothetical protein
MAVEDNGYLHRDAFLGAKEDMRSLERHSVGRLSSQTRRNAREVLHARAAIFHAI